MPKGIALALIVLGIALAPIYYVWTRFFSGQLVARQSLQQLDATEQSHSALAQHSAKFPPIPIELRSDMAPLAIALRLHVYRRAGEPAASNTYRLRFSAGAQDLLSMLLQVRIAASAKNEWTQVAAALNQSTLPPAGKYQLHVDGFQLSVPSESIEVTIRRNAQQPSWPLIIIGATALAVGIVGMTLAKPV